MGGASQQPIGRRRVLPTRRVRRCCLPLTAVLALALAAAAQARLPNPSLYGLNTGTFDTNYRHFVRDIPTAGRLGARWVHLSGDNVHSRAGHVDFSVLDLQVRWARQRHLGVLITLGGIRDACSQAHLRDRPEHCPPLTGRDLRRYGTYEATVLRRYRGQVDYFESWNEPNHRSFWSTGPDPAAYARLLTTQYRVMQSVAPHDHLLFAATGGTELAFIKSVLDALGGKKAFDAVGLHPYRFPPRPVFTAGGIQAVDGQLAAPRLCRRATRRRATLQRPRLRAPADVADGVRLAGQRTRR
jgi:hypothetical protein